MSPNKPDGDSEGPVLRYRDGRMGAVIPSTAGRRPRFIPLPVSSRRVAYWLRKKRVRDAAFEEATTYGWETPQINPKTTHALLANLLKDYLAFLRIQGRSETTLKVYRSSIGALCRKCGWRRVREISAASFLRWRSSMPLKPRYADAVLVHVRMFLDWLVFTGQARENALRTVQHLVDLKKSTK